MFSSSSVSSRISRRIRRARPAAAARVQVVSTRESSSSGLASSRCCSNQQQQRDPDPSSLSSSITSSTSFTKDHPRHSEKQGQAQESPPPLLLEYDDFYVSSDGITRTIYQMAPDEQEEEGVAVARSEATCCPSTFSVEEIYDLNHFKKTFVVRDYSRTSSTSQRRKSSTAWDRRGKNHGGIPAVEGLTSQLMNGDILASVPIDEVREGVESAAGTGATTWEASIAASLYFGGRPELLHGNVVELGCGVGAGGILNLLLYSAAHHDGRKSTANQHDRARQKCDLQSMLFTDYSDPVLKKCSQNIWRITTTTTEVQNTSWSTTTRSSSYPSTSVSRLDWYRVSEMGGYTYGSNNNNSNHSTFDTVLACDCVYRHQDIQAFCRSVQTLLRDDEVQSRAHIFGPVNRAPLQSMVDYFKDELQLFVTTEVLTMDRYRLRPSSVAATRNDGHDPSCTVQNQHKVLWNQGFIPSDACSISGASSPHFLHIVVSHRPQFSHIHRHFSDID